MTPALHSWAAVRPRASCSHHSPLTVHHAPLATRHSPLATHRQAEGELLVSMQQLRLAAQDTRLDMTDAFESYAGKGREGQLGIMPKNRFQVQPRTLH